MSEGGLELTHANAKRGKVLRNEAARSDERDSNGVRRVEVVGAEDIGVVVGLRKTGKETCVTIGGRFAIFQGEVAAWNWFQPAQHARTVLTDLSGLFEGFMVGVDASF